MIQGLRIGARGLAGFEVLEDGELPCVGRVGRVPELQAGAPDPPATSSGFRMCDFRRNQIADFDGSDRPAVGQGQGKLPHQCTGEGLDGLLAGGCTRRQVVLGERHARGDQDEEETENSRSYSHDASSPEVGGAAYQMSIRAFRAPRRDRLLAGWRDHYPVFEPCVPRIPRPAETAGLFPEFVRFRALLVMQKPHGFLDSYPHK